MGDRALFDLFRIRQATPGARRPPLISILEDMHPAVYIHTGTQCDLRCRYCIYPDKGEVRPLEEIARAIETAAELSPGSIPYLIGGEPTAHPDFDGILSTARGAGLRRIGIATNAARLGDRDRVRSLVDEAGVDTFMVSLDSHLRSRLDWLSRSEGAWERVDRGVHSLLSCGGTTVLLNMLVCRATVDDLTDNLLRVRRLEERYARRIPFLFSALKLEGLALDHREDLAMEPAELAARIAAVLDRAQAEGMVSGCLHMVPCLMPDHAEHCTDIFFEIEGFSQRSGEVIRSSIGPDSDRRPSSCLECSYCLVCPGPSETYLEAYGEKSYQPVPSNRTAFPG